jgi:hypothetical protein
VSGDAGTVAGRRRLPGDRSVNACPRSQLCLTAGELGGSLDPHPFVAKSRYVTLDEDLGQPPRMRLWRLAVTRNGYSPYEAMVTRVTPMRLAQLCGRGRCARIGSHQAGRQMPSDCAELACAATLSGEFWAGWVSLWIMCLASKITGTLVHMDPRSRARQLIDPDDSAERNALPSARQP